MATATPGRTESQDGAARPPEAPAASPLDRHASPVDARRKSGKATASLVLGIIGVLASVIPIAAWVLGGIALGLGLSARSDIRRKELRGAGLATSGIVLGVIAILAGIGFAVVNAVAVL